MRKWEDAMFYFLLFANLFLNPVVLGQKPGFISIDCGGLEASHVDAVTGIEYVWDSDIMKLGVNQTVATQYMSSLSKYLWYLRSFPYGKRNCYTVGPVTPGTKYLLRASFMYGNYDGLNSFPQFDLYLGVNFVRTVSGSNSKWSWVEVMFVSTNESVSVCLLKTTSDIPFISSIELRPMNVNGYAILNSTNAMVTQQRDNFGSLNGEEFRYPDDSFDRLWLSPSSTNLVSINTTLQVNSVNNDFSPPSAVMQTAVINSNSSGSIVWDPSNIPSNTYFYMCLHIAELQKLKANQTREFKITLNYVDWYQAQQPEYLTAVTTFSKSSYLPLFGLGANRVELKPTARSTLSPIFNALEFYIVRSMSSSLTDGQDVDALTSIKNVLSLKNNWTGDPCLPQGYAWDNLVCSNDSSPRITSLDLSNSGLSGEIPPGLSQLTALVSLNLSDNNLGGLVPDALLRKNESGSLLLSISGNQNLCSSSTCNVSTGRKVNKTAVIGIVVAVIILLAFAVCFASFIIIKRRHPKQPLAGEAKFLGKSSGCQTFSYAEIMSITDNFRTKIGEGGYGPVFHGCLQDGQNVAVKILSDKSKQGSKEFYTEVTLLSRIHHKNLVSFFGYCDEAENMILVYEYIPMGNLQNVLSGRTDIILSWNQRLQIAFNAAQGLDYLHSGCKPGIIHRDIKSANILLDDRLEAKIADFGMSKSGIPDGATHISTVVVGTHGYLDPEYYLTNRLNEKSDVYSFGVVLLELITGMQPIMVEPSGERTHLVNWVRPRVMKGDIASIADPKLLGRYEVGPMWKVAETALECTAAQAANRPSMSQVVSDLKEAIESYKSNYASGVVSSSNFRPQSVASTSIYTTGSTVDEDIHQVTVIYESPAAR
ncbi:probable LRR receptor-like serine/threonine-protein kinase At1g05700 isoform X2 [Nymphaea colorata]|uniref:probable LRR receptor-like serine/threonine-protein kinase At1g05700 isoform X2 n=1 Tax=Nymphaea colorata TaxID=210225 RepID=UPI00129E4E76|nr:probable LRR receptor-like serine/threonine-protein kinase At1g05700 isoform X2 [Nymphaea colorata]